MTRAIARAALIGALALSLAAVGCAKKEPATPVALKIGTLTAEDSLPLWVAEQQGYFATKKIPGVEIVTYKSAAERDAALSEGKVQAIAADVASALKLEAAGMPVTIETLMLGADPTQGRFAVMTPPGKKVESLARLVDVPIASAPMTVQEYALIGLMDRAGVPIERVALAPTATVPEAFDQLMKGKVAAAVLPEPYVTLAVQGGASVVENDVDAPANPSQTTLVFSDMFLKKPSGALSAKGVLGAWDLAVRDINKDPKAYRDLLLEKVDAGGNPKGFEMSVYPTTQLPSKEHFAAVLDWMRYRGYIAEQPTYEQLTVAPSVSDR